MPEVAVSAVCGFCGGEVERTAIVCPACGSSVVRASSASDWHAFTPGPTFAALWFLSFGIYSLPWFYRAWRFLRDEAGEAVRPHLRTAGLFVPLLNLYWAYELFERVENATDGPAREAWIVLLTILATNFLFRIGGDEVHPAYVLGLAICGAAFWMIQRRINTYYRNRGMTRSRMPVYGWVICGLGALGWVAVLLEWTTQIA